MLMTLLRKKEEYNVGNKEHATHLKLNYIHTCIYTHVYIYTYIYNLPAFISRL